MHPGWGFIIKIIVPPLPSMICYPLFPECELQLLAFSVPQIETPRESSTCLNAPHSSALSTRTSFFLKVFSAFSTFASPSHCRALTGRSTAASPRAWALSGVREVAAVRGVRRVRELCVVHVVHEMRVRAGKGGGARPKS